MKSKIKTYRMSISEYFPKTHKRAGEKTEFVEKIKIALKLSPCWDKSDIRSEHEVPKLHTIRQNHTNWKRKIDDVVAGNAILLLFSWSGIPYRSKQINLFVFAKNTYKIVNFLRQKFNSQKDSELLIVLKDEVEIGVQKLEIENPSKVLAPAIFAEEKDIGLQNYKKIAENDGLTYEDWCEWFRNSDYSEPLAIIHFTKFRY